MSLSATQLEPALVPSPGEVAASAGTSPAIDLAVLAQLHELDRAGVRGLIGRVLAAYRASLARLMAQLTQGRSQGNLMSVRIAAHTLKSSSASIGALAMSAACAAVEQAIREAVTDGLPRQLELLAQEAVRADSAVQQLQHRYPPP